MVERYTRRGDGAANLKLAAALFAVTVTLACWRPLSQDERPLDPTALALLLVIVAPVAVRHRWPLGALLLSAAAAAPYHALDYPHEEAFGAALVLLYTLALRASRARLAAALGAVLLAAVATSVLVDAGPPTLVMLATLGWLLLAAAVGVAVQAQRAYVGALTERAVRAERSREEEAARRVAEERLRIARDLHDALAHTIVVINAHAGVAAHLLDEGADPGTEELAASMRTVAAASSTALAELRGTLDVLRAADGDPDEPGAPGVAGLHQLADPARNAGIAVTMTVEDGCRELGPAADVTLYRIAQESLTNVLRHAGATAVTVSLECDAGWVRLRITDDGVGSRGCGGGYGIVGMRERAHALGGRLGAGPGASGGFEVLAELPLRGSTALVPR